MVFNLAVFVAVTLASAESTVKAVCPGNPQEARVFVDQCTLPLTGNNDLTVEGAIEFCNGTAMGVVSCVEGLLADCEGVSQDAVRAINAIIDFDHLNQTLVRGCDSVSLILEDRGCVGQQINTTVECLENELADYALKIRALQSEVTVRGFKWLESEQRKAVCRYTQALGACASLYIVNCNQHVYDVYHSFLTAFQVPNCDRILSETVAGSSTRADGCPATVRDAVSALSRCTIPLVPLTTFNNGLPDPSSIKTFCGTSADATVACLEKLRQCSVDHPDLEVTTRNLAISEVLGFLHLSCVNLNLLSSQQKCVEKQSSDVNSCVQGQYSDYYYEVLDLRAQTPVRGFPWFQSSLLQASCRYSEQLLTCIKPYKNGCNYMLGIIYESLVKSTRPTACVNLAPTPVTTPTTTESIPVLVESEFL